MGLGGAEFPLGVGAPPLAEVGAPPLAGVGAPPLSGVVFPSFAAFAAFLLFRQISFFCFLIASFLSLPMSRVVTLGRITFPVRTSSALISFAFLVAFSNRSITDSVGSMPLFGILRNSSGSSDSGENRASNRLISSSVIRRSVKSFHFVFFFDSSVSARKLRGSDTASSARTFLFREILTSQDLSRSVSNSFRVGVWLR